MHGINIKLYLEYLNRECGKGHLISRFDVITEALMRLCSLVLYCCNMIDCYLRIYGYIGAAASHPRRQSAALGIFQLAARAFGEFPFSFSPPEPGHFKLKRIYIIDPCSVRVCCGKVITYY
jgi:hypothetical protein